MVYTKIMRYLVLNVSLLPMAELTMLSVAETYRGMGGSISKATEGSGRGPIQGIILTLLGGYEESN
jgi:hypothetical protein